MRSREFRAQKEVTEDLGKLQPTSYKFHFFPPTMPLFRQYRVEVTHLMRVSLDYIPADNEELAEIPRDAYGVPRRRFKPCE